MKLEGVTREQLREWYHEQVKSTVVTSRIAECRCGVKYVYRSRFNRSFVREIGADEVRFSSLSCQRCHSVMPLLGDQVELITAIER